VKSVNCSQPTKPAFIPGVEIFTPKSMQFQGNREKQEDEARTGFLYSYGLTNDQVKRRYICISTKVEYYSITVYYNNVSDRVQRTFDVCPSPHS
jgi:hypothetical protein